MKSLLASKRSKAILGIKRLAISSWCNIKKVAIFAIRGSIKGGPAMTFNLDITSFHFKIITWEGCLEGKLVRHTGKPPLS